MDVWFTPRIAAVSAARNERPSPTRGAPSLPGPGSGAACLALLLLAACSWDGLTGSGESGNWKAGTAMHAIVSASRNRTYVVHVPPKRRFSSSLPVPWPLVIVLHGSSGDATSVEEMSQMDSLADAYRFLVAYPNGTGGGFNLYPSDWNAGTCCGGAYRDNVDDVGFIAGMITSMSTHVPVDQTRIYVAGFSAGARMAYHVGCQLSGTVAAIGVIEGSLVDDACKPASPVPLFAVHGTDDAEVAWGEPTPAPPPGVVPALANTLPPALQFWTALSRCTGGARTAASANVTRTRFTACLKTDIDFYAIAGGTHGWPGGPVDPGAQPPMNELKASVLMWQFFIRHRRL